ncbi:MAG: 50S ribosomal protein L10 [Coprobacillus sp.]|nr:50S ribosomal protein L10 [Coprobacillus sp.]
MNQDILEEKKDVVKEIVSKAKTNKTVIIAEYRGLTVAQMQEIRRALRKENASLAIYKNSLVSRAFDELGYTDKSMLTGPNSFIFSEDEFAGMKIISKYARRYNAVLHIKGAIIEGQLCDEATVKELSKLDSKDSLVSMLLSCLEAPIRSFACAVKAVGEKAN